MLIDCLSNSLKLECSMANDDRMVWLKLTGALLSQREDSESERQDVSLWREERVCVALLLFRLPPTSDDYQSSRCTRDYTWYV